ncbi:MAG: quinone-dependent dihydroorotate dehydrogenase [Alistipes sp.]|nr:quinone-dependent dihydroorotate dehydrogenase [Alistipes sp.]
MLFRLNAERAHAVTAWALRLAGRTPLVRGVVKRMFTVTDPRLEREVFGMKFPNPVGLAAGFDKNAGLWHELSMLGLGFVEIGTVTPLPQPGNPRPRLFRLPKDRALVNRMGFNNEGMENAADNLRGRPRGGQAPVGHHGEGPPSQIVGVNIGKNTLTPPSEAPADYLRVFRRLYELGDYFVVNVSCPNVAGLTSMQTEESLLAIVEPLLEFRRGQNEYKPILVKISPDLSFEQIDQVLKVVTGTLVDGVVATNTTGERSGPNVGGGLHISRKRLDAIGNGGLSGAPLTRRAIEVVRYVHQKTEGAYPIIGTGGVMTTDDALAMLDAGADLVQIYTGLVYNGPGFARKICKALLRRE